MLRLFKWGVYFKGVWLYVIWLNINSMNKEQLKDKLLFANKQLVDCKRNL